MSDERIKPDDKNTIEQIEARVIVQQGQPALVINVDYPAARTITLKNDQTGKDEAFVFETYLRNVTHGTIVACYKRSAIELVKPTIVGAKK